MVSGYAFVQFKCFDDFSKFLDINCRLNNLYTEEHRLSTLLRNEERLFYYNLKEVEKFVDYCKKIEIDNQDHDAFFYFVTEIRKFIREYEEGFKHKNKKKEKSLIK